MNRQIVHSKEAPAAIGPYSQAVKAGGFLFVSGQIPLDLDGEIVGDDAASQTRQVLHNLREVLAAGGAGFGDVVRTTIYLADMNDFAAVNEEYGSWFKDKPPARVTVEVSRLPRDVKVEIDAVAYIG